MKENIDKVLERDEKLHELDDRAEQLQYGAAQFETNATRLKRKMWWQNVKVNCFIYFRFIRFCQRAGGVG
jgi:hypothetical protein